MHEAAHSGQAKRQRTADAGDGSPAAGIVPAMGSVHRNVSCVVVNRANDSWREDAGHKRQEVKMRTSSMRAATLQVRPSDSTPAKSNAKAVDIEVDDPSTIQSRRRERDERAWRVGLSCWSARGVIVCCGGAAGRSKGFAWNQRIVSGSLVANANVALLRGHWGRDLLRKLAQAPRIAKVKVPFILFLHGSSGLGLNAIGSGSDGWPHGVCKLAPDSMVLPDRITTPHRSARTCTRRSTRCDHRKRAGAQCLAIRLGRCAPAGFEWGRRRWSGGGSLPGPDFAGRMIFS